VGKAVTGGIWFDSERSKRAHPVLRYVSFGDFEVYEAREVTPGPEDEVVARSEQGLPLVVVRQEQDRTTTMLTFDLGHADLPLRMAFPVMLMNVLSWYVEQDSAYVSSHPAGEPVRVGVAAGAERARVCGPEGCEDVATEHGEAVFVPMRAGFYTVSAGGARATVAANLQAPDESRVMPAESVTLAGRRAGRPPEIRAGIGGEIWVWLVIAAALIVVLEWLTYHRRVTV
jgi:hypothetical protein